MHPDSVPGIDRFIDALWLEDGLSPNTLAAYRRDLTLFAQWLGEQGVALGGKPVGRRTGGADILSRRHGRGLTA